jgi:hypothetical protein
LPALVITAGMDKAARIIIFLLFLPVPPGGYGCGGD